MFQIFNGQKKMYDTVIEKKITTFFFLLLSSLHAVRVCGTPGVSRAQKSICILSQIDDDVKYSVLHLEFLRMNSGRTRTGHSLLPVPTPVAFG